MALYPALLCGQQIGSFSFPGRQSNQGDPRHRVVQAWQGLWSGDTVQCALSPGSKDQKHNKCYVTANAHGFTRNAHQEPKPIPILDRRTKKLNSGLRPWLRFSLMHMEARECGGTERHCQPHWLHPRYNPLPCCPHGASVIVLAPFCPGPHCVYTPEWPASHIRTASLIPSHRNPSYRVQKSLMAIVCERLYSPQRALTGLSQ